ncbi:MAG: hypothetical protein AABX47_10295 [Nanoarchaeota archaeon]
MSDTICIPKEEYDFLIRCRHIVASEFSERFSDRFIAAVKESEESHRRGESIRVNNPPERRALFDSL